MGLRCSRPAGGADDGEHAARCASAKVLLLGADARARGALFRALVGGECDGATAGDDTQSHSRQQQQQPQQQPQQQQQLESKQQLQQQPEQLQQQHLGTSSRLNSDGSGGASASRAQRDRHQRHARPRVGTRTLQVHRAPRHGEEQQRAAAAADSAAAADVVVDDDDGAAGDRNDARAASAATRMTFEVWDVPYDPVTGTLAIARAAATAVPSAGCDARPG
eukprot:scaffold1421_cov293-Prasinococcus_capsulatus_cf.AAC.14